MLGEAFWACVEQTHGHLEILEQKINDGNPVSHLIPWRKDCPSKQGLWTQCREAVSEKQFPGLLWCFMIHCEALPLIPLRNRSIGTQRSLPDLEVHLREVFYPKIFSVIDTYISEWNLDLDIDGNIFVALLGILFSSTKSSLSQRLGNSLSQIASSIVLPSDDSPHFKALKSVFSADILRSRSRLSPLTPKKLLPFHHDVFDEGFSLIDLPTNDSEDIVEYGALEFGKDTIFNDHFHWHNPRRHILPKYLGGGYAKPTDERQRNRLLKTQQWFMSRLTVTAASLTGASGASFSRLIIVTGTTDKPQGKLSDNSVRSAVAVHPRRG